MPVALKELSVSHGVEYDWFVGAYTLWLRELSGGVPSEVAASGDEIFSLRAANSQRIFLLQQAVQFTGFAIVEFARSSRGRLQDAEGVSSHYRLIDFFVDPAYRRLGFGAEAIRLLALRFRGTWEVSALDTDMQAVQFWRAVPSHLEFDVVSEQRLGGRWILRFRS